MRPDWVGLGSREIEKSGHVGFLFITVLFFDQVEGHWRRGIDEGVTK
jgi:hypothetical protein